MNFHRLRQPLAVWLTLLIAVFGALSPTLSLAVSGGHASTQAMVEICSSHGSQLVAVDGSPDSPSEPGSALHSGHCSLCLHAADRALPLPSAAFVDCGTVGEAVVPAMGQAFRFITLPAVVPPPRGPPLPL